ncbi:unnamed protein product [Amaranthus hypochondriacus]
MEGGGGGGTVGPTTNTKSQTHAHSRPVRTSSRFFYGGHHSSSPATFSGPVRRWEKKWVQVSPSNSATPNKPRKLFLSNGLKSHDSPILLCKWTPLSRPSSASTCDDDLSSGQVFRRKFRYTPVTVVEEKKRRIEKGVADGDISGDANPSAERSTMDSDDMYGLPDINSDIFGAHQRTSECDLIYSRRSHLNLGMQLDNKNTDGQPDLNVQSLWAMN